MLKVARLPLFALVSLIGLDSLTKQCAAAWLNFEEVINVIPGFNLSLAFNQGMAFSLLSEGYWWQRIILSLISWCVGLMLTYWLCKESAASRFERWMLVFLAAGAVGNGIDRVLYGYVIDFIDLYYGSWHFATFNLADIYINVGVVLLVINHFFIGQQDACSFSKS